MTREKSRHEELVDQAWPPASAFKHAGVGDAHTGRSSSQDYPSSMEERAIQKFLDYISSGVSVSAPARSPLEQCFARAGTSSSEGINVIRLTPEDLDKIWGRKKVLEENSGKETSVQKILVLTGLVAAVGLGVLFAARKVLNRN